MKLDHEKIKYFQLITEVVRFYTLSDIQTVKNAIKIHILL